MLSVRGCSTYTTSKWLDRSVPLMRETHCKGRMTLYFFLPLHLAMSWKWIVVRKGLLFTMPCRYAKMYQFLFCKKQLSINKITFDMELSSIEISIQENDLDKRSPLFFFLALAAKCSAYKYIFAELFTLS